MHGQKNIKLDKEVYKTQAVSGLRNVRLTKKNY